MKQTIKTKLLEMLRSGEYPKVNDELHNTNGFCFGGLLCELHRLETGQGKWCKQYAGFYDYVADADSVGEAFIVPWAVEEWAGIDDLRLVLASSSLFEDIEVFLGYAPDRQDYNNFLSIYILSDEGSDGRLGLSFPQIADLVEKYIEAEPSDEIQE